MNDESDSHQIDRLVLGLLPNAVALSRMLVLADSGWTHREIAGELGLTLDVVAQRISRAKRKARVA